MKKELLFLKRKKARELHKKRWSNRKIARFLLTNKDSIRKWINLKNKDILIDKRGWKKGIPRKYTLEAKEEIINIRKELEKENSYFIGSKVVKANYENKIKQKVSKTFVDRTLKEGGIIKGYNKKRRGLSKYMKYPQRNLNKLGKSMMSIDFIGPKYLSGSNDRINFLSCKYIRPEKHGIVRRIDGQTSKEAIRILKEIWETNPLPDVIKVDNDKAALAGLSVAQIAKTVRAVFEGSIATKIKPVKAEEETDVTVMFPEEASQNISIFETVGIGAQDYAIAGLLSRLSDEDRIVGRWYDLPFVKERLIERLDVIKKKRQNVGSFVF